MSSFGKIHKPSLRSATVGAVVGKKTVGKAVAAQGTAKSGKGTEGPRDGKSTLVESRKLAANGPAGTGKGEGSQPRARPCKQMSTVQGTEKETPSAGNMPMKKRKVEDVEKVDGTAKKAKLPVYVNKEKPVTKAKAMRSISKAPSGPLADRLQNQATYIRLHKLTTTALTTRGRQAAIDKHIIRHGVHEAIKCPNNPAEVSATPIVNEQLDEQMSPPATPVRSDAPVAHREDHSGAVASPTFPIFPDEDAMSNLLVVSEPSDSHYHASARTSPTRDGNSSPRRRRSTGEVRESRRGRDREVGPGGYQARSRSISPERRGKRREYHSPAYRYSPDPLNAVNDSRLRVPGWERPTAPVAGPSHCTLEGRPASPMPPRPTNPISRHLDLDWESPCPKGSARPCLASAFVVDDSEESEQSEQSGGSQEMYPEIPSTTNAVLPLPGHAVLWGQNVVATISPLADRQRRLQNHPWPEPYHDCEEPEEPEEPSNIARGPFSGNLEGYETAKGQAVHDRFYGEERVADETGDQSALLDFVNTWAEAPLPKIRRKKTDGVLTSALSANVRGEPVDAGSQQPTASEIDSALLVLLGSETGLAALANALRHTDSIMLVKAAVLAPAAAPLHRHSQRLQALYQLEVKDRAKSLRESRVKRLLAESTAAELRQKLVEVEHELSEMKGEREVEDERRSGWS